MNDLRSIHRLRASTDVLAQEMKKFVAQQQNTDRDLPSTQGGHMLAKTDTKQL